MRRREIGSEFWNVPVTENLNKLFPESTQWYLSGRSALQAIIAQLGNVKSVSLPSWCCYSMIKPFADFGLSIDFYPVFAENGQLVQKIKKDSDVLFLIDYFGYSSISQDLCGYNGVVIRDITHSIFSSYYSDADYYFGSLRKWCGLWTGGYAWTRGGHRLESGISNSNYISLRARAMEMKKDFIEKGQGNKEYLKIYEEAEKCLETAGIAPVADRDIDLSRRLDVGLIKEKRRINATVLMKAFPEWLFFPTLAYSDTPLFVPVLVPDGKRDELRRYLISHEIYCPVHWSVSKYHRLDDITKFIYDNELSLVCDQRYDVDDMNRIVETIQKFWREG